MPPIATVGWTSLPPPGHESRRPTHEADSSYEDKAAMRRLLLSMVLQETNRVWSRLAID